MTGIAATEQEMMALGEAAGKTARPGDVFALTGDLGAGKTHWTKGFMCGLASAEEVTSPTFGLIHEYTCGRLPVYHFDFYRLETPEELLAMGWDEYLENGGIIIAEWADRFPQLLPLDAIRLAFRVRQDGAREVSAMHHGP